MDQSSSDPPPRSTSRDRLLPAAGQNTLYTMPPLPGSYPLSKPPSQPSKSTPSSPPPPSKTQPEKSTAKCIEDALNGFGGAVGIASMAAMRSALRLKRWGVKAEYAHAAKTAALADIMATAAHAATFAGTNKIWPTGAHCCPFGPPVEIGKDEHGENDRVDAPIRYFWARLDMLSQDGDKAMVAANALAAAVASVRSIPWLTWLLSLSTWVALACWPFWFLSTEATRSSYRPVLVVHFIIGVATKCAAAARSAVASAKPTDKVTLLYPSKKTKGKDGEKDNENDQCGENDLNDQIDENDSPVTIPYDVFDLTRLLITARLAHAIATAAHSAAAIVRYSNPIWSRRVMQASRDARTACREATEMRTHILATVLSQSAFLRQRSFVGSRDYKAESFGKWTSLYDSLASPEVEYDKPNELRRAEDGSLEASCTGRDIMQDLDAWRCSGQLVVVAASDIASDVCDKTPEEDEGDGHDITFSY